MIHSSMFANGTAVFFFMPKPLYLLYADLTLNEDIDHYILFNSIFITNNRVPGDSSS